MPPIASYHAILRSAYDPSFIPGIELARRYWHETVAPIVASYSGCGQRAVYGLGLTGHPRLRRKQQLLDDHGQAAALLGALGFEHVKVVFEEPPKT